MKLRRKTSTDPAAENTTSARQARCPMCGHVAAIDVEGRCPLGHRVAASMPVAGEVSPASFAPAPGPTGAADPSQDATPPAPHKMSLPQDGMPLSQATTPRPQPARPGPAAPGAHTAPGGENAGAGDGYSHPFDDALAAVPGHTSPPAAEPSTADAFSDFFGWDESPAGRPAPPGLVAVHPPVDFDPDEDDAEEAARRRRRALGTAGGTLGSALVFTGALQLAL